MTPKAHAGHNRIFLTVNFADRESPLPSMMRQSKRTEVFAAVLSDDIVRLRKAVAEGGDCNLRDELGVTPLYYAITRGHADVVGALLDCGADIELSPSADDPFTSPLMLAENEWGLDEVGALLRSRGAM